MFVQNLIGCEEQARLFKEEVRPPGQRVCFVQLMPTPCSHSSSLQMIDGEALLLLTQTDIVKIMSIKLGPALKISNAILMFKTTDEGLKWYRLCSLGQSVCAARGGGVGLLIIMCQIHFVEG